MARRRYTFPLTVIAVVVSLITALVVEAIPGGASSTPTVGYTYDAAGRLLSVTSSGKTSTYSYDPAGNITKVSTAASSGAKKAATARQARLAPHVSSVTPRKVTVGQEIRISGRGFSPHVADNVVKVGSLIAHVRSASSTALVVAAPPGPGGAVVVRTPDGSATAPVVTVTGEAPSPAAAASVPKVAWRAPQGVTALNGVVELPDGRPVAGVTVSINDVWAAGSTSTVTDARGEFLLSDLTPGQHTLVIDADHLRGRAPLGWYSEPAAVPAGTTTTLPWVTYLTPLDVSGTRATVSPSGATVVSNIHIPGLQVVVPKGTVIHDAGRLIPASQLSVTRISLDRTPFPLAPGMPMFVTLQPGGATFSGRGISVVYPNVTGARPGTVESFVAQDPSWRGTGWYQAGTGVVDAAGTHVVADGVRYRSAQPFGNATNPPPPKGGTPGGPEGGEPIELSAGLYVMNATDLSLPDAISAVLTRTYRDQDDTIRGFGIGMSDGFDLYVTADGAGNYDLVLPDGSRVAYAPTSTPGTYQAVGTPTEYVGSTLVVTGDSDGPMHIVLRSGTTLQFSNPAYLTGISTRYGASLTIDRNDNPPAGVAYGQQITKVVTNGGKWMAFTYGGCVSGSSAQCITQVTDDAGRTVSYAYDGYGRLVGVTDAAGGHTTYTWAACTTSLTCTELLTITDADGIEALQNTYDPNTGDITAQTDPDGGLWNYSYSTGASGAITQTTVVDPRGERTVWSFGSSGYPTSEVVGAGTSDAETTTFDYDASTNLLDSTTDPLGRTTSYTYDALGNTTSVTRLAGTSKPSTTTYTYEPVYNRLASTTDPDGDVTTFAYNDKTRTQTETDALGHKTTITYNTGLQPTTLTDAEGHSYHFSYYDGDLVAVADPEGNVATGYYDGAGNVLQVSDAEGNTATFTYSALAEPTSVTDPAGDVTTFAYDPDGNTTSVTDPDGHTTKATYTPLLEVASTTDGLGKATKFTYDTDGNLTGETDRNGSVDTFAYDPIGRLTTSVYGSTSKTGKITVTDSYDAANRLIEASQAGAATGAYKFTYDGLDDVLTATSPQGNIASTYDAASRLLTTTPGSQAKTSFASDADGLVTSLTQGASKVSFGYNADNLVATIGLPDGITRTNTFDADSDLTGITYATPSATVGSLGYTYDADSQVASVTGSLASTTLPPTVTSASFNADDELTAQNGTSYTYDARGDLTSDGTNTYTWNNEAQLTGVSSAGTTSTYTYDPFGRPASSTTGGTATTDLYNGEALVQQTTGGTTTGYLSGGQDDIYQATTGTTATTLLADRVGSIVALANSSGAITGTASFAPFGTATTTGATTDAAGYTGAPTGAAGLDLFGARYYDPAVSRFTSQDPSGFFGGTPNLYQYAADSPTVNTDPSGRAPSLGGAVGAVTGYYGGEASGEAETVPGGIGAALGGYLGGDVGATAGAAEGAVQGGLYGFAGGAAAGTVIGAVAGGLIGFAVAGPAGAVFGAELGADLGAAEGAEAGFAGGTAAGGVAGGVAGAGAGSYVGGNIGGALGGLFGPLFGPSEGGSASGGASH